MHLCFPRANWYKISVEVDGVYKIDYDLLKKIGINPDAINPQNIKLYGSGNGMLPQPNSTSRINDLQEIAIFIKGADDGSSTKMITYYSLGRVRTIMS